MPNYAIGFLEVEGLKEDIEQFLKEGLEIDGNSISYVENKKDKTIQVNGDKSDLIDAYIKNLNRHKIDRSMPLKLEKGLNQILFHLISAWDLSVEGLKEVSQKYNLILKGEIEESMEGFEHYCEIEHGVITKDKYIEK